MQPRARFQPRPKTAFSFFDVLAEVAPEMIAPAPAAEVASPTTVPPVEVPPPVVSPAPAKPPVPELRPEERDYVMEGDPIPSGMKTRIAANIAAIRLSKRLASENRLASPEEKQVLAAFSGFGGCKEVLNNGSAYFFEKDSMYQTSEYYRNRIPDDAKSWYRTYGKQYNELRELLTESEWTAAVNSTLNAHYTSPAVARQMWDLARQLGFRGGKVAEPAFGGNGVFIGTMPADLRAASTVWGTELDEVSARIAQQLYPQCKVENIAFQDALVSNHSQDLVITNVPFSDTAPAGQTTEEQLNLHNYFISLSMDKLKPGGLALVITSASTLQNNRRQREFLAEKTQMLGAIRLPSDAFEDSANTEVVTDVLVLRKPDRQAVAQEPFVELVPVPLPPAGIFRPKADIYSSRKPEEPETTVQINEYFFRHPEMVLGYHSMRGKMYGGGRDGGQYTVSSPDGAAPLVERLAEAIKLFPSDVPNSSTRVENDTEETRSEQLMAVLSEKIGSLVLREGRVYQVGNNRGLVEPPWRRPVLVPAKGDDPAREEPYGFPRGYNADRADELARDYIGVRECYKRLIAVDLNPVAAESDSQTTRAELNRVYDAYVERWGSVRLTAPVEAILGDDPEFGAVCALETVVGDGAARKAVKAQVFTERTLFPAVAPKKADTIQDGVMISLGQKGEVVPGYVAELCGRSDDVEGVQRLIRDSGLAFENPETGRWESRAQYLSGNVVAKLEVASNLIGSNPSLSANVAALEGVQPKLIPFDQISIQIGASWVPDEVVTRFAREKLGQRYDFGVRYYPMMRKWVFTGDPWASPEVSAGGYGTKAMGGMNIFENALNQRDIRITWKDDEGRTHFDEAASRLANQQKERMGEDFLRWIKSDEELRSALEESFNEAFNNMVVPEYKGDFLAFPGLSNAFVPRPNQRDAVARGLTEQAGLFDHKVGFGKTLSLILVGYESKRIGLANKPMIVCYNSNYAQFVDTIRQAYPQANILVANADSMNRRNRDIFLGRVQSGNWDLVVMAQSHFDLIPNRPETHARFLQEEIAEYEETLNEMQRAKEKHVHVRRVAKALESKREKLAGVMEKLEGRQDNAVYWEDLGVDLLLVDEIDAYKKVPFSTLRQGIKGIDTQASQRATNLFMKARHIQDRRNGRGVIGATGTPISNTMAEAWNMTRLTHPKLLEDFNIRTFDQYCSTFCVTVTALELNEANNRWKYETRLAKFINGPIFINFIRAGWDVKMDASSLGLGLPKMEQELKIVPLTGEVADQLDGLSEIYKRYESHPNKMEMSWVPLMLLQVGKTLSVDPRLVNPSARDNPASVANRMVDDAVRIWRETKAERATQAIFLDQYRTMDTSKLAELKAGKMGQIEIEDADAMVGKSEEDQEKQADKAEAAGVGEFNLYHDIKRKLIARGVPEREIVIVNEVSDPAERKRVFDRLNSGELRFALGSTRKLGTGNNFQQRLLVCHHFDPPRDMTPRSLEQRTGRMERPGNTNPTVYNKLWGMQDSVIPGVYQRILRKDAFIKQALAGKGVGQEFEDCGDVRLQEFTGLLVSDKRVMRRAELQAEIREEKMRRELSFDRARDVVDEIRRRQSYVERLELTELPAAEKLKAWFAANVQRPPALFSVGGAAGKDEAAQVVRIEVRETGRAQPMVFEGPCREAMKEFTKQVLDLWKKQDLPANKATWVMGTVTINGMRMTVEKSIASVLDNTTVLHAIPPHPLRPGESLTTAKFGSAEALMKLVQVRSEEAASHPDRLRNEVARAREGLAKVQAEQKTLTKFDEGRLNKLQTELFTLEEDMRANPVGRRARRSATEGAAREIETIRV